MQAPMENVEQFIESLPKPVAIRERLAVNAREQDMLKQMLRLSEQRESVREVRPMNRRRNANA